MKKTFVAALCLLAIGLAVVMIRTDWMNNVMKLGRKENTPVYCTFNGIDGGYFLDAVKANTAAVLEVLPGRISTPFCARLWCNKRIGAIH